MVLSRSWVCSVNEIAGAWPITAQCLISAQNFVNTTNPASAQNHELGLQLDMTNLLCGLNISDRLHYIVPTVCDLML